ncbi:MAG: preprotein translocase subunit SecE [Patescibacteria group bacterium]|nr:preprotein translocase subunit SecE [Patescibacteria group bacterium]
MSKAISFIQEAKQELHRVEWPTKQETIKLTLAVIFVSLIVAVYLGALDYGFTKALELFI